MKVAACFGTTGAEATTTVDRMLASDASAEQFARHWLDAVRYAWKISYFLI